MAPETSALSLAYRLAFLFVFFSVALGFSSSTPSTTTARSSTMKPTPIDNVASIVARVESKATEWKEASLEYKIDLLEQVLSNTMEYSDEWTSLGMQSRGIHPTDPLHGSARADVVICTSATFGSYLNGLIATLKYCASHDGAPPPPKSVRAVPGTDKTIATLWPSTLLDHLESVGLKGELVLGDGGAEQMNYNEACVGGVAGILGAGNFDAPIELLCELFLKGRVCIYKPNPVNQLQFEALAKILDPLVTAGFLDFVVGGVEAGTALIQNPALDEIVLTGSVGTYEKIKPLTDTPITAELGGVNCWMVVPSDKWSRGSVDDHARHLAFARLSNNGHTCAAPQVILVDKSWKWRGHFMDRLRFWIGKFGGAPPFYPGSAETHESFCNLQGAEVNAEADHNIFAGQQRCVLFADASLGDEENSSQILSQEAFCPVLAEVPIDGGEDPMKFLHTAADVAEQKCFGSLTCNILIPDREIRRNQKEFDRFLADIPFGITGVNFWPAFAHSMPQLLWGAPPGHPQSGIGLIGNATLYRRPQKAILRAPFFHLGRKALHVMPPQKTEKFFRRLAAYKLRPNHITQTAMFVALFLGI